MDEPFLSKLERIELAKAKVIANRDEYDFPDIIRELRLAYSISRLDCAKDLGIKGMKLYNIERGAFDAMLSESLFKKLAIYFQVSYSMLKVECRDFLRIKKRLNRKKK